MTLSFDPPQQIGPIRVVALTRIRVAANHTKKALTVFGYKSPVAILIRQGAILEAFGPEGAPMSRDDIERLCPGAWDSLLADE